jgi:hypothetical protein
MIVRTMIDPDCPYVPFTGRGHTPSCDPRAHVMLAMSVSACVEPPYLRAMRGDHELCRLVPCAFCRQSVLMRFWLHPDDPAPL